MSTGQYTEVERLRLEALDARIELALMQLERLQTERGSLIKEAVARNGGKPARNKAPKVATEKPAKARGGWPKGKPRGKRKSAVEAIAFPSDGATSEAAQ